MGITSSLIFGSSKPLGLVHLHFCQSANVLVNKVVLLCSHYLMYEWYLTTIDDILSTI